ncbi:hypothetical protein DdX_12562 [Ditylenchus destructor]|uniref:Uncharacterized protein n=1 Tax=Ditylenchus destructor TaxID=166010 RepID=A0AAD4R3K5_9BILA|nr:hypothetical protein DdX_12562 [Ditylenchus destructor]
MTFPKSVTFLIFAGSVLASILTASAFVDLESDRCRGWAGNSMCTNDYYFENGMKRAKSVCTICPQTCAEACEKFSAEIPKWQDEWKRQTGKDVDDSG